MYIVPASHLSNCVTSFKNGPKALKPAQNAIQSVVSGGLQQTEKPAVSVDFKIVSLGPQGQEFLALVCLGTADESLYIFDVAHSSSILLESGLKDLLESSDWVKVIHDCKRVCSILFEHYGIHLQEVFDTQVAHAVLQHVKTGKGLHEIRSISFFHLQRIYYPESLMQSDVNPRKVQKLETGFWSQRPLTEEMIRVAVEEVRLLVPYIYSSMDSGLSGDLRDLFSVMCIEQVDFNVQKQEVKLIRQERRQKYTLNIISDKLVQDPSGVTLSNRERKLVTNMERQEQNGVEAVNGESCCMCKCHKNGPKVGDGAVKNNGSREVATQTLSTGAITMTGIYYENN